MKLMNIALSAVAASVLAWGSAAHATTYQFGTNISGNGGPAFGHFADVTVTDTDSDGNWEFTIDAFGLNAVLVEPPHSYRCWVWMMDSGTSRLA